MRHPRPAPRHFRLAAAPDPAARQATVQRHVQAAQASALAATRHADACWAQLCTAIQNNHRTEEAHTELLAALAQQVYAWAVFHATSVDAHASPGR